MNRITPIPQKAPKVRFAGKVAIVARSRCRMEREWMPSRNREGLEAARLQFQHNTQTSSEIVFIEPPASAGAGYINAWICQLDGLPDKAEPNRVWIPEGFLREPGTTGPRLVQCQEGYDGQVWDDGVLISTRWWPIPPGRDDWRQFIDGTDAVIGLPEDPEIDWIRIPDIEMVPWRQNLSLHNLGRDSVARVFSPLRLALIAILLLVLPFGLLAGSYARLSLYIAQANTRISELSERNDTISQAQKTALAARTFSEAMAANNSSMVLVDALSDLRTGVPQTDASISYLSLADQSVEVRIRDYAGKDTPALVQRLEATDTWSSVSASTNRNGELVIKGIIRERKEDAGQ